MDALRWDDQQKLAKAGTYFSPKLFVYLELFYFSDSEIVVGSAVNGTSKKGGKGKGASATSATGCNYDDYNVEYAKSGRSECYACDVKIPNKEIRISKLDYNSETVLALGRGPVVSFNFNTSLIFPELKLNVIFAAPLPSYGLLFSGEGRARIFW